MAFIKIAKVSDLDNEGMKKIEANGKSIILIVHKKKIYALQADCTHKNGPLWEGKIDGGVLICPWHSARFDIITGKVQKETPWAADLKRYDVKIKDKNIYVNV